MPNQNNEIDLLGDDFDLKKQVQKQNKSRSHNNFYLSFSIYCQCQLNVTNSGCETTAAVENIFLDSKKTNCVYKNQGIKKKYNKNNRTFLYLLFFVFTLPG